ncbi:MAG: hypothetical protein QXS85_06300 [Acidilobaceae archaeon]
MVIEPLRSYKMRAMRELHEIRDELLKKYPERSEDIEKIMTELWSRLFDLKSPRVCSFLSLIARYSRDFSEVRRLAPTTEELIEILSRRGR